MKSHDARLQRLEAATCWRDAARAGAPHGIGPDAILRACLRWLALPVDEMRAEHPDFTEAECQELKRSRLTIARALQSRGRLRSWGGGPHSGPIGDDHA
jgi:hypothetical protein